MFFKLFYNNSSEHKVNAQADLCLCNKFAHMIEQNVITTTGKINAFCSVFDVTTCMFSAVCLPSKDSL